MSGDERNGVRRPWRSGGLALADMDGLDQAGLVIGGELRADELLEAAIERAERINPRINAITRPMWDEARQAVLAGVSHGPFRGLPFLLKDAFATYAGVPTSSGSKLSRSGPALRDSHLVTRFKAAGAVVFGKTNVPEFGSLCTTEPALFGPTLNPWRSDRSAGGSSGGAAAAVAARIVPVAHASDGAGSIRIPASCCGLVGLKATRGRISHAPHLGENVGGMMSEGVVSLSVRDTAAMLDVSHGFVAGDPYCAPPPARPFLEEVARPSGRLRIALTRHSLLPTALHEDCVAAVDDAATLCAALGHVVVEDAPVFDGGDYYDRYRVFWPMSVARTIRRASRDMSLPDVLGEVEPFNRYLFEVGGSRLATDYIIDLEWFQALSRTFAGWMQDGDYDLWLTPTLGSPPPPIGHFDAARHGGEEVMRRFIEFLPFTTFNNMTGQPGMTLPLHWNSDGLPVGVHMTAGFGGEEVLLRIAGQLELARPWRDRRPPICA